MQWAAPQEVGLGRRSLASMTRSLSNSSWCGFIRKWEEQCWSLKDEESSSSVSANWWFLEVKIRNPNDYLQADVAAPVRVISHAAIILHRLQLPRSCEKEALALDCSNKLRSLLVGLPFPLGCSRPKKVQAAVGISRATRRGRAGQWAVFFLSAPVASTKIGSTTSLVTKCRNNQRTTINTQSMTRS